MQNSSRIGLILVGALVVTTVCAPIIGIPYLDEGGEEIFNQVEEFYRKGISPIIRKVTGEDPPSISIDTSKIKSTYYLNENPKVKVTVSNKGGSCRVSVGSKSFELGRSDSATVTLALEQTDTVGQKSREIRVEASNEGGTDSASERVFFKIKRRLPDIDISISMKDKYYLGDRPTVEFTVTNNGGSCEVNYTAFETQQESGSFQLDSNNTRTITETGGRVRQIGDYRTSVEVEGSNESGTDTAKDEIWFQVTFHHINGKEFVTEDEKSQDIGLWNKFEKFIQNPISNYSANAYDYMVRPDSETIVNLVEEFQLHIREREILAKDLYYWTAEYITYDYEAYTNEDSSETFEELPAETIYDEDGVCLNYAVVLASLYEAAGYDAKLMTVWNEGGNFWDKREDYHALVLLSMPLTNKCHRPFNDEWVSLDPTRGGTFGKEYDITYDHYDTVDVE